MFSLCFSLILDGDVDVEAPDAPKRKAQSVSLSMAATKGHSVLTRGFRCVFSLFSMAMCAQTAAPLKNPSLALSMDI